MNDKEAPKLRTVKVAETTRDKIRLLAALRKRRHWEVLEEVVSEALARAEQERREGKL